MEHLYRVILNDGLMQRKFKNSKVLNLSDDEVFKGSVFVFTSKEKMCLAQGIVMTSVEGIKGIDNNITHWTPNIYQYGEYTDSRKLYVKGHQESNLKKINTFYLDIDSQKIIAEDILLVCLNELGLMPTMILKTTRGYQVYFVLKTPAYVTDKSNYRVIEVAKMISQNIRYFFMKHHIPVDLMCNHFGIARFPNASNTIYFNAEAKYDFNSWLTWSQKFSDDQFYSKSKQSFGIYQYVNQVDEKWVKLLLNQTHFKGKKGVMGRNNTFFTLALAHYSSNVSQKTCEEVLEAFNDRLNVPISLKELHKIIKSAYSGEYLAASKAYIYLLCKEWVDKTLTHQDLFTYQRWYKYKKSRHQRINSHFYEWEEDVLDFFNRKEDIFIRTSKKDIQSTLGIPSRSLDYVLKSLKDRNIILFSSYKGRHGGIKVALIQKVYSNIITLSKAKKEAFLLRLIQFIGVEHTEITATLCRYNRKVKQQDLFELDIGEQSVLGRNTG